MIALVLAMWLGAAPCSSSSDARASLECAVREGPSATFAVVSAPSTSRLHWVGDLRPAMRWSRLGADDVTPLEGLRELQLWNSRDCLVAVPAAMLLWREATARDVAEMREVAADALTRCDASLAWKPTALERSHAVDWHWLVEVGLRQAAREHVREALADGSTHWSWAFAWVELGETHAPAGTSPEAMQHITRFVAFSGGDWARLLEGLSTPFIGHFEDTALRALALHSLGRHAEALEALAAVRLYARVLPHPLELILDESVSWVRSGTPMSSVRWLSSRHVLRRGVDASPADRAALQWESPFW